MSTDPHIRILPPALSEDSCRPVIAICERKHVFAYFLFHVCLWIILDGARNIPIFSRYFLQHYRKIKLQFDVLKLRKRKHTATHINNWDDVKAEGRCVWKLHSYKKLKHLHIIAHWNLPCGVCTGKKSELLLQCSQRSFINERSHISEQWHLKLSLRLSGNSFWTRPAAQCSWSMSSYCQHSD